MPELDEFIPCDLLWNIIDPLSAERASGPGVHYDRYGRCIASGQAERPRRQTAPLPIKPRPFEQVSSEKERERINRWHRMLHDWHLYSHPEGLRFAPEYKHLKHEAAKGIPDGVRAEVWCRLLGADAFIADNEDPLLRADGTASARSLKTSDYARKLHTYICPGDAMTIGQDVRRALCDLEAVRSRDGLLRFARVSAAVTAKLSDLGYNQSYCFIIAMLLNYMPEPDAYWSFLCIVYRNNFRNCFIDMFGVMQRAAILERFLCDALPRYKSVISPPLAATVPGCTPASMWATKFIMTLFFRDLPHAVAAKLFDRYLVEGERVVYRALVAMLEREMSYGGCKICKNEAEFNACEEKNILPALDSPFFAQEPSELIQRLTSLASRITVENSWDLFERMEGRASIITQKRIDKYKKEWIALPASQNTLATAEAYHNNHIAESAKEAAEAGERGSRLGMVLTDVVRFDESDHLVGALALLDTIDEAGDRRRAMEKLVPAVAAAVEAGVDPESEEMHALIASVFSDGAGVLEPSSAEAPACSAPEAGAGAGESEEEPELEDEGETEPETENQEQEQEQVLAEQQEEEEVQEAQVVEHSITNIQQSESESESDPFCEPVSADDLRSRFMTSEDLGADLTGDLIPAAPPLSPLMQNSELPAAPQTTTITIVSSDMGFDACEPLLEN